VVKVKLPQVLGQLRARGLRLLATSSHKGIPLPEAALSGPLAIFIGGEGAGLGRGLISEMDEMIVIPHSPKVESLNAGVAASIVLYEVARQRRLLSNGEC
jgi:RNA methyltransferase, TrmH family